MFPNYLWDVASGQKDIYLTFDDGPTPEITTWTLDVLKRYNAKATFFCIGSNIQKQADIFLQTINDGHAIGNHTQHHIKGWRTTTEDYLLEVEQAQSEIEKLKSSPADVVKLFRPPYGQIKPEQGKKLMALGYKIVMWDVLSFDWEQEVSEEECFKNVMSKSKQGSIIVFHDSIKASKNMMYTLPKVLEHFTNEGYTFKALGV